MSELEWVTNAVRTPAFDNVIPGHDETRFEALKRHREWRAQFVVGEPKATDAYSVEELKGYGMVGLYRRPSPPST